MNVRQGARVVVAAVLAVLAAGCATTGGSQIESSIYDTHRMVKTLDTNLQPSVQKLNETAANLDARVATTEEQTRRLQGMLEESQMRLGEVQRKLDELSTMVARGLGYTVPRSSSSSSAPPASAPPVTTVPSEGVTMGPPPEAPPVITEPGVTPVPGSSSVTEPEQTLEPMPSTTMAGGNAIRDYEQALSSYRNENYQIAIQQFDEFLKRYPDNQYCANSQYWKAYSYAKLKEYDDAVREFEKMRALYPTDQKIPLAIYNQAAAHSNLGQIAETKALLEKLIAQYPDAREAQAARSDLAKLQGT